MPDLEETGACQQRGVLGEWHVVLESILPLAVLLLDVLQHHCQIIHDVLLRGLLDPEYLGALVKQLAAEAHIDGCFEAVASHHPKLDASIFYRTDGVDCAVLEPVFDCGRT